METGDIDILSQPEPESPVVETSKESPRPSLLLTPEQVMEGFDRVIQLYPYTPSLSMWRAWEVASYKRYTLREPALDVGCGDGVFFRLVWPEVRDVVGVDHDAGVVAMAQKSGVYREVLHAPARQIPVEPGLFKSAFANCSLEHMDGVGEVLREIYRSLEPGGDVLLSVGTDKLLQCGTRCRIWAWSLGGVGLDSKVVNDYCRGYHHYVNPFRRRPLDETFDRGWFWGNRAYTPIVSRR